MKKVVAALCAAFVFFVACDSAPQQLSPENATNQDQEMYKKLSGGGACLQPAGDLNASWLQAGGLPAKWPQPDYDKYINCCKTDVNFTKSFDLICEGLAKCARTNCRAGNPTSVGTGSGTPVVGLIYKDEGTCGIGCQGAFEVCPAGAAVGQSCTTSGGRCKLGDRRINCL